MARMPISDHLLTPVRCPRCVWKGLLGDTPHETEWERTSEATCPKCGATVVRRQSLKEKSMPLEDYAPSGPSPATLQAIAERRFRILWVSPQLLMSLPCFSPQRQGDRVEVVSCDLPEDCHLGAIAYNEVRDAFALRICHPSFDPVPDCHPIPVEIANFHMERLTVVSDRPRGREFI